MRSRLFRVLLGSFAVATATALPLVTNPSPAGAAEPPFHRIVFPVQEKVSYSDDFGAPRAGGRTHQGNDLMGAKLDHELAVVDGVISSVRVEDGTGISGNMLTLKADDGWFFYYIHVNNDTPGTDDAANPPEWRFAPGIHQGSRVRAGDFIAYMGDSGDAETTGPHLHFEVHQPDGTAIDPYTSLRLSQGLPAGNRCSFGDNPDAKPSAGSGSGYWVLGDDGGVFAFGGATFLGSTGNLKLNKPVVGMAATPTGKGYWLDATDGGIFAFGDATFSGSTGNIHLNQPIVGMAAATGGQGYWLLAGDGGMFTFGKATYSGSLPGTGMCNHPGGRRIVPTATGKGYWIVGDDGSTWAFGDARWFGAVNTLGLPRVAPIVGFAVAP
ncbi:MAG: hypothetical protein QOG64_3114 [Acidimicrobiaceae bacterium]|nr:hypothetical protein [Acidimicrobiaceae bacterium]